MKKSLGFLFSMLLLLFALSSCSDKPGDVSQPDPPPASDPSASEPATEALDGELCEAEKFSIIAPAGWKVLELPATGGFQLYKSSGEAIQVEYAGSNQSDDAAEKDVAYFAENKDGTEPVKVELLGKEFWATTFEFGGEEQTLYARMEDGVKLTIQTVKGNYENNAEYKAILDSIEFK